MGKRKLEDSQNGIVDDAEAPFSGFDAEETASNPVSATSLADLNSQSESDNENSESDHDDETSGQDGPKTPVNNGRPTKKQRKQITAQEVQMARETAELFKSNIFKLQIDELMSEIKIKDSHVSKIEKVLHRLHDCISQVPAIEDLSLAEAEATINAKKVAIAFPDPKPTKVNYKFGYLPPAEVSLVGSFGLKTGITQPQGSAIDIALTMPQSLFSPKDYLNYRALYKRSFYVAYLADQLIPLTKKNGLPVKISYTYLNDDVLCPVLTLESISTDNDDDLCFHKTKFTLNLLVALPFGVFDAKKLLPDRNCIRVQSEAAELPPTPYYNSSLLSLTTYDYYLKYLYANKKAADSFKDACTMGRLWLQQRGFGSAISKGGFGHFEFAILLAALLSGGGINGNKILLHGFSSYQLFKGAIKYLATMDLTTGYLSFSSSIGEGSACKFNPDAGFNTPTLFDKTVKLNVLWKMTKSAYSDLRQNAVSTLTALNDVVFDRFDAILLQKVHQKALKYDLVYELEVPDEIEDAFGALEKISFITLDNFIRHKIHSILRLALGERVTSLAIFNHKTSSTFALAKRKPSSQFSKSYTIGVQLNADECDKLVTKGPNDADAEAVAKFRSFWKNKTSLRRFKDGTIQHCVVWPVDRSEPLVSQIIGYSLDTHLHPQASKALHSSVKHFTARLPEPSAASGSVSVTSTANYTQVKNSFEALSKYMFTLDMPLGVKTIMPASAAFRNSTLLQPVPFALGNPDFWGDAVLQFESSTRWPDEIVAMEKTKSAFLLRISSVMNKDSAYRTFLTRDDSIPFNGAVTLLNVLTPDGYGFRIRVLSEKDEVLYLRAVRNSGTKKALVQDVYFHFNQKYLGAIKHTRTMGILASAFPYYSPTVRLFKEWLDAHTLLSQFCEELVELIALKPFVDPAPFSVPNSVEKGFLQILAFLAHWNWKDDPLVLDLVKGSDGTEDDLDNKLSERLSAQAYQVIRGNFDKIRASDPSGMKTQFFVGTRDDPSGILWSSNLTLPIASRLTALARAATQLVQEQGASASKLDLLFTPALGDFDFVIKMKENDSSKSTGLTKNTQYKNLGHQTYFPEDITSKSDVTPVLVDLLKKRFGGAIIFSSRKCAAAFGDSTNMICGVFVPVAAGKKKFRVSLGVDVKPTGEGDEVVINKEAIFDQVRLLGGDAIKSIKFRK